MATQYTLKRPVFGIFVGLVLVGLCLCPSVGFTVLDTWTRKADMPTARGAMASASVNGKIYVFAGLEAWCCPATSAVEEYDPATDTWTKKADMPSPARGVFATGVVDNKIYVIGGESGGSQLNIVDEYDPLTDSWVRKANMPTARNILTGSAIGGRIYTIGGMTSSSQPNSVAIVEEYDTGFIPSSTVSVDPTGKLTTRWATIKQGR